MWESFLIIFQITQDYTDHYRRLLNALYDLTDLLGPIQMDSTTFADSEMVSQSLVKLYIHIIELWVKAIRLYSVSKWKRFCTAFRSTWFNYSDEYNTFQTSLKKDLTRLKSAIRAEHHREVRALKDGTQSLRFILIWQKAYPVTHRHHGTPYHELALPIADRPGGQRCLRSRP